MLRQLANGMCSDGPYPGGQPEGKLSSECVLFFAITFLEI